MLAAQADYLHLPSPLMTSWRGSFAFTQLTHTVLTNRFCDSWSTASFGPQISDMQMRAHHGRPITR